MLANWWPLAREPGLEDTAPSQAPTSSSAHRCPFESPWDGGGGQTARPSQASQRSAGNGPPSPRAEPRLASATPSGARRLQLGPSAFLRLPSPPWTQFAVRTRQPSLGFGGDAQESQPVACRCQGSDLAPFQAESEGGI